MTDHTTDRAATSHRSTRHRPARLAPSGSRRFALVASLVALTLSVPTTATAVTLAASPAPHQWQTPAETRTVTPVASPGTAQRQPVEARSVIPAPLTALNLAAASTTVPLTATDVAGKAVTPAGTPLSGGGSALTAVGTLRLGATSTDRTTATSSAAAVAAPGTVGVRVLDSGTASSLGVAGVLLQVTPTSSTSTGSSAAPKTGIDLSVDYSSVIGSFTPDQLNRLTATQLPGCPTLAAANGSTAAPVTVSTKKSCQTRLPLSARNDLTRHTLTVTLPAAAKAASAPSPDAAQAGAQSAPMTVALTAGAAGTAGDYSATSLTRSSSWQAGDSSGGFSWSYPFPVPPTQGGPSPALSLSYSSQMVDGHTASTNNQPSWIGEGFESSSNYVQRRYQSCSDNDTIAANKTGDQCWAGDNLTLSLNGKSSELIYDGAAGRWRMKDDDGTKIEKLAGAANGDQGTAGLDGVGEYWKVTDLEGTQYIFGVNRLPGWVAGNTETNSVNTVPVFGNQAGEPCHAATFDAGYCQQAWRWNLDRVIDIDGNSSAYYYAKQSGVYGRDGSPTKISSYDFGSYPARIDYGMRSGAEYSTTTPATQQVTFAVQDRCVTQGATCVRPALGATSANWPDVPWDQYCPPGSTSCAVNTPTFFSTKMLSSITTKVLTGVTGGVATYKSVDGWVLTHSFPNPNSGTAPTTNAALWLSRITHTGTNGAAAVTDPDTIFYGSPLANRVNRASDGLPPMNSFRVNAIRSDSGDMVSITYSGQSQGIDPGAAQNCTGATVDAIVAAANTSRCYPAWYAPYSSTKADWFHKYLILAVVDDPYPGAAGPSQSTATVTSYQYLATPAWALDDDDLTPAAKRLYNSWRGYATVRTVLGDTASNPGDPRQATDTTYFRGLGTSVTDSFAGSHPDGLEKQGRVLEEVTYDGLTGTGAGTVGHKLTSTISDYWVSAVNASRGPYDSRMVRPAATTAATWLPDSAAWRTARTTTTYNGYGLPLTLDDEGDLADAADGQCTRTTYATANTSAWLVGAASRVETVAARCTDTAVMPRDAMSDTRYYYDGSTTLGAVPTRGHATTTETLKDYTTTSAASPVYQAEARTVYDTQGRVTQVTDVLGRIVKTGYTPAAGGPVTTTTSTDALGFATATVLDTGTGKPVTTTDVNGKVTSMTYDGLGRLTGVWAPGWVKADHAAFPSSKFTYVFATIAGDTRQATGANYTTTSSLKQSGTAWNSTYTLLDGMLRPRQTQSVSASVNTANERVVTDTFYNSRGQAYKTWDGYKATGIPSGTLFTTTDNQIDAQTRTVYDGAGRPTAAINAPLGAEKARSTTVFDGDHTDVIPSGDGSATRTYTDARGQTTKALTFPGPNPAAAEATADATTYTYTRAGLLASVKDAGGSTWTYGYDVRGRQTDAADPDKGASHTVYDAAGRATSSTDALGHVLVTSYDNADRTTAVRQDTAAGPLLQSYTYDTVIGAKGQLASASSWYTQAGTAYEYKTSITDYSTLYQPKSETLTLPSIEGPLAGSYTTTHTYATTNGAHTGDTFPAIGGWGSETINYGYTGLGLPFSTVGSRAGTLVSAATYDAFGDRITLHGDRGAAVLDQVTAYTTDTRQPATTVTKDGTANVIADLSYGYTASGDLIRQSENKTGDTQCYTYDGQRRLTAAWTPTNGAPATPATNATCAPAPTSTTLGGPARYWQSWTYDANGSRSTQVTHGIGAAPSNTDTYTYPAATAAQPHAVTAVSSSQAAPTVTGAYTFTPAGDLTARPGHTYTWDRSGHLDADTTRNIATGATVGVTSYRYDATGQRLLRHDKDGVTLYLAGTEVRYQASQYGLTRYYGFGDQTIGVRSSALGTPTVSTLTWCINDLHNTAIATLDANDTTKITRRYQTPFGDERTATGVAETGATGLKGAIAGNHTFLDGIADSEGSVHLGAREYLPQTGQFISVDPVNDPYDPQQLHPYSYAHNDPINASDPTGLSEAMHMDGGGGGGGLHLPPDVDDDPVPHPHHGGAAPQHRAGQATSDTVTVSGHTATVTHNVITRTATGKVYFTSSSTSYEMPPPPPQEHESGWKSVWKVVADVTGITDIINCVTDPSIGSCVMAAVAIVTTFVPVAKGAVVAVKAARAGVEVARAAEEVAAVSKTIKVADEAASTAAKACSFTGATVVLMADGSHKPIDRVSVGDAVIATDPETGEQDAKKIEHVFVHYDTVTDLIVDGEVIRTTEDHPFWSVTDQRFERADELAQGEQVLGAHGRVIEASGLRPGSEREELAYNLAVEGIHTYHVGDHEILVHNSCTIPSKSNYRDLFAQAHPNMPAGYQVHHALPQRYAAIMQQAGVNIHETSLLRGVDPAIHSKITTEWGRWHRSLGGSMPNAQEITQFSYRIDETFGSSFVW